MTGATAPSHPSRLGRFYDVGAGATFGPVLNEGHEDPMFLMPVGASTRLRPYSWSGRFSCRLRLSLAPSNASIPSPPALCVNLLTPPPWATLFPRARKPCRRWPQLAELHVHFDFVWVSLNPPHDTLSSGGLTSPRVRRPLQACDRPLCLGQKGTTPC